VVGAGALLCFEGVVRPTEDGRALIALDYEAYEPMAQQQLDALGRHIVERHGLLALQVEHSRGRVPVGLVAFRLRVASAHRQEGLAAMEEFIDRMKRDVPIWKTPVFDEVDATD
jgi:molybdopterin synthase catalytic subunit